MASKNPSLIPFAALGAALLALSPCASFAQAPAPAPAPVAMDKDTANKLYDEAAKAFTENKYDVAAEKLEALLKGVGQLKTPLIEQLRFSLGLAYLSDNKFTEAERAFTDCLRQFPKGDYTSRCYLGIGKARVANAKDDAGRKTAIEPLQRAAADPKFRSEAGQTLGQVYTDLKMDKEALGVFRSLMGSDIRSPGQTVAAVEVINLLAQSGKLDDLVAYLDRLIRQAGIRDVIAWYTNQVIVAADALQGAQDEAALTIYRTILPRQQILDLQRGALEDFRKQVKVLEDRVKADEKLDDVSKRSNATELLNALKPAVEATEKALKWVEEKVDLDAYMLMSRGRVLYHLDRLEEALVCFKTIRTKYPKAGDLESAAYAEVVIMQRLKRTADLGRLAKDFIAKFPESRNAEQVLSIVAESQMEALDYKGAAATYDEIIKKFPNSANVEGAMFMQASGLMLDGQFADAEAAFGKLVAKYPKGTYTESAYYRIAFCFFLTNDYKNTLAACQKYLTDYPGGMYYGDVLYRLSFINFQDKKKANRADEILESLGTYVESHKEDAAASSMYALIGDVWAQLKTDKDANSGGDAQAMALSYYIKAIWVKIPNQDPNWEVVKYCLEAANGIMQTKKDLDGIAKLNGEFIKAYPTHPLAMVAVGQVAKVLIRQKKGDEAAEYLGAALAPRIGDPGSEEAEHLIETLLSAVIPVVKKPTPEQIDEIEKKVVEAMEKVIGANTNPTTNARLYYARALVRDKFHDNAKRDLYIMGIATSTAPEALSPQLLAVCADALMRSGDLDKAQAMYERLRDKYQESAFSDAGPVGVARIALAKKLYAEADKLFDAALANPGSSMIYEAMLGKIETLDATGKSEEAEALALKIIGDKQAGHKNIAIAYLDLAQVLRNRAEKAAGEAKHQALVDANGRYNRVMSAYKAIPDLCAKAYWGSYEVLTALGDNSAAMDVLRQLATDPKMEKTPEAEKARKIVK